MQMRYKQSFWRFLAVTVLVAMLAGSISAVSWAFDPDERVLNEEGDWSQKIKAGRYDNKKATSSSAFWQIEAGEKTASPSDMLEQEVHGQGRVEVEWFRILVDGEMARDSDRPETAMKEGREIPPGRTLKIQMKATFHVDEGGFEPGDYVEWRLGTYPGLSLPYEVWEEVMIDGVFFGEACLGYQEDSTVYLRTVITDHINEFENSKVWIQYTYESGFFPVYERTPVDFQFPGWDKPIMAILLPVMKPDPSDPDLTDPETTETAPSEPESTEPETTATPSEPDRPSGGGGASDRGNGSSSIHTAAAEIITVPESIPPKAETIGPEAIVPVPKHQAPEKETTDQLEGSAEEKPEQSSEDEPTGIEVSASYSVQGDGGTVENGAPLTAVIEVANTGKTPVENLRIRNLLPKHTSFLGASDDGTWGIREGQEQVTWKFDEIEPGESRTLEVKLQVYRCTPVGYRLDQTVYWQDKDSESVNSAKNPEHMVGTVGIAVE